jgi:hypothetical protein
MQLTDKMDSLLLASIAVIAVLNFAQQLFA